MSGSEVEKALNKKPKKKPFFSNFKLYWAQSLEMGKFLSSQGWIILKHITWFVVTTGMITALPLLLEVKREYELEDMEKLRISAGLAEGKTPQELAYQLGLASAIEPKVLK